MSAPSNRFNRAERRIYRLRQVMDATGFGRAWIYELMKRGEFPKAHKIGTRAVGWSSAEVDAWVAAQLGEER
ncbi:AlpA family transcriptional regulator [Pseudomonas sp. 30_B]|uniref:helix-turn-helix transcriptional regulator n=1 Tax=Pseudomonas sp. 30_B TaxID=2813575 RepID=UPI001A9E26F4|nr:AlpA family transcriptional regulator [Pseudomonas sp. 30_B]